jgi:hypothetical protein
MTGLSGFTLALNLLLLICWLRECRCILSNLDRFENQIIYPRRPVAEYRGRERLNLLLTAHKRYRRCWNDVGPDQSALFERRRLVPGLPKRIGMALRSAIGLEFTGER